MPTIISSLRKIYNEDKLWLDFLSIRNPSHSPCLTTFHVCIPAFSWHVYYFFVSHEHLIKRFLFFLPKLQRRIPKIVFDIFSKEARIGETCLITHFFHAQRRVSKIVSNVCKCIFLYPFLSRFVRVFFANHRKVLRWYT